MKGVNDSFKPCYKWITFNTYRRIGGDKMFKVLNLVINGLPSILQRKLDRSRRSNSFKPCYKWITFNTLYTTNIYVVSIFSFKPCYKWITFNILTESIDAVFMVERSHFYMVAKTIHFSVF